MSSRIRATAGAGQGRASWGRQFCTLGRSSVSATVCVLCRDRRILLEKQWNWQNHTNLRPQSHYGSLKLDAASSRSTWRRRGVTQCFVFLQLMTAAAWRICLRHKTTRKTQWRHGFPRKPAFCLLYKTIVGQSFRIFHWFLITRRRKVLHVGPRVHDRCCFFPNLKPFSVVVSLIRQEKSASQLCFSWLRPTGCPFWGSWRQHNTHKSTGSSWPMTHSNNWSFLDIIFFSENASLFHQVRSRGASAS